jgi:hypothetical protein
METCVQPLDEKRGRESEKEGSRVRDISREGHEGVHSGSGIGHGERNGLSGDTRDACEDSRSLQSSGSYFPSRVTVDEESWVVNSGRHKEREHIIQTRHLEGNICPGERRRGATGVSPARLWRRAEKMSTVYVSGKLIPHGIKREYRAS